MEVNSGAVLMTALLIMFLHRRSLGQQDNGNDEKLVYDHADQLN